MNIELSKQECNLIYTQLEARKIKLRELLVEAANDSKFDRVSELNNFLDQISTIQFKVMP